MKRNVRNEMDQGQQQLQGTEDQGKRLRTMEDQRLHQNFRNLHSATEEEWLRSTQLMRQQQHPQTRTDSLVGLQGGGNHARDGNYVMPNGNPTPSTGQRNITSNSMESAQQQIAYALARQRHTDEAIYRQEQENSQAAAMVGLLNQQQQHHHHLPPHTNMSYMRGANGGYGGPADQYDNMMNYRPYANLSSATELGGPRNNNNNSGILDPSRLEFRGHPHAGFEAALAAAQLQRSRMDNNGMSGQFPSQYSSFLANYPGNSGNDRASMMGVHNVYSPGDGGSTTHPGIGSKRLNSGGPRTSRTSKKKRPKGTVPTNYDPGPVRELSLSSDRGNLSEYQCLLREQIQLFSVTASDIQCSAQGRNKPIQLGQVGVLCKHCSRIPPGMRSCGAVYFPAKLSGLYQASQNMAINHFARSCHMIPEDLRARLLKLKERKSTVLGGGKHFWANGARVVGVVEGIGILNFKDEADQGEKKKIDSGEKKAEDGKNQQQDTA